MTVFEVDDAAIAKAETLLMSPDFPKPVVSEKKVSVKHDDLYDPSRPMKKATPVRVNKQGERIRDEAAVPEFLKEGSGNYDLEELLDARPVKVATPVRVSRSHDIQKSYRHDAHPPRPPDPDEPDGLPHIEEYRHRTMLEQEPRGGASNSYADVSHGASADAHSRVQNVQEEILRTKQLLGMTSPRQHAANAAPNQLHRPATSNPELLGIQASMDKIEAEIAGFSDTGASERAVSRADSNADEQYMQLKEEVAALRTQVLRAKAARMDRASSVDTASSIEDVMDVRSAPHHHNSSGKPELWGSRRSPREPTAYELQQEADQRRGQQCLSGGERYCFPNRQCA